MKQAEMRLSLFEHPDGVATEPGNRVVYDIDRNEANYGAARVDGPALVWEIGGDDTGAALSEDVDLGVTRSWIVRCDRIDFPPGSVAYRHTHPGAGIRRVLAGSIHIAAPGHSHTYGPGDAWFEAADYPVLATASGAEPTAFVRAMLLPAEWEGRRTIRYVDQADEGKPKLQRPTVFFDRHLEA
jgi:cupin domain